MKASGRQAMGPDGSFDSARDQILLARSRIVRLRIESRSRANPRLRGLAMVSPPKVSR